MFIIRYKNPGNFSGGYRTEYVGVDTIEGQSHEVSAQAAWVKLLKSNRFVYDPELFKAELCDNQSLQAFASAI